MKDLKLIVLENSQELGEKIVKHLKKDIRIPITNNRFSNGEGKITMKKNANGSDLYILSDVGNYSITYNLHGKEHAMSPNEHFQDIKRVIAATSGHAKKINVIMPLLYESRQHKRKGNESLDCAIALQELEKMGVANIITFDAHDPSICNAIPRLPFENFYPTNTILEQLNKKEHPEQLLVIAPDMGATERARYYAEVLKCDVGVFYKRRDLTKVINGKNPIVEHTYMGTNPKGKDILIVDDMIASGTSMIEVAEKLKEKSAKNIYLIATFALFTEGINLFKEAYKKQLFTKLYTTNLSYIPKEIEQEKWLVKVDCSKYLAKIIKTLNQNKNIEDL